MTFSRADIAPVFAIIVAGSIGMLTTGALLFRSSNVDVRVPQVVYAHDVAVQVVQPPEDLQGVWISTEVLRIEDEARSGSVESTDQPIFIVDGIRVESKPQIYVDGVRVE